MGKLLDSLKTHFKNTPKEQLDMEWKKIEPLNEIEAELLTDELKITATIERNANGYYMAYSKEELFGHSFGGFGYSEKEVCADFMTSVKEAVEMVIDECGELPAELQVINLGFRRDY